MIQTTPQLGPKDPREVNVITLDATLMLASGETLTGTPTITITTITGNDATPSLTLTGIIINSAVLSVAGKTIAVGAAVQAVASLGQFGSTYFINAVCTTSNPNKTLVLKAEVVMFPQ